MKGCRGCRSLASFDTREGPAHLRPSIRSRVRSAPVGIVVRKRRRAAALLQEFDNPATNNGIAENADSDEFSEVLRQDDDQNLTLQGLYGASEKAIPTASFGTVFNDPRSQTIERQGFVDRAVQPDDTERAVGIGSRVYVDRYGYDGDYVFDYSETDDPLLVLNKDFARGNWWGTELKLTRKLRNEIR